MFSACHSLPTPLAIVMSVRSRFVAEHGPQHDNEQQRCDGPVKPDLVRIAEKIDQDQESRNRERCCNGRGRVANRSVMELIHVDGWYRSPIRGAPASGVATVPAGEWGWRQR